MNKQKMSLLIGIPLKENELYNLYDLLTNKIETRLDMVALREKKINDSFKKIMFSWLLVQMICILSLEYEYYIFCVIAIITLPVFVLIFIFEGIS